MQDSTGASLAVFDSVGNVNILGNLSQNSELYAGPKDFAIQNSTGQVVAYINSTGGLFLTGTLTEKVLFG